VRASGPVVVRLHGQHLSPLHVDRSVPGAHAQVAWALRGPAQPGYSAQWMTGVSTVAQHLHRILEPCRACELSRCLATHKTTAVEG
jgi:hypothetical protein